MTIRGRYHRAPASAANVAEHEVRLRFALFVARPGSGAMLIGPDNECAGWLPIIEAVQHDRTFAVEVPDDILAIDQDHCDLARALDRLHAKLLAANLRPVVLASGRPG